MYTKTSHKLYTASIVVLSVIIASLQNSWLIIVFVVIGLRVLCVVGSRIKEALSI